MKILLILALSMIISFSTELNAQNIEIDNLRTSLEIHKNNNIQKVDLLNKLAYKLYDFEANKTLEYAQEAEKLGKELDYKKGIAESWRMIGYYNQKKSNFESATTYYQKALKMFKEIGSKTGTANSLTNIGSLYKVQEKYKEAINTYDQAVIIHQDLGNKESLSKCFINMGTSYFYLGNYSKAIEGYQKSLSIDREIGNQKKISKTLNNIGVVYKAQGLYKKALEAYQESQEINIQEKDNRGIAGIYHNVGSIYYLQSNYTMALKNWQMSLTINEKFKYKKEIGLVSNNIGSIYLIQEDYPKALENFKKYLKISEEFNNYTEISKAQINIGNIYVETNDFLKAMEFFKKALERGRKLELKQIVSEALISIGRLYYLQNEYDKAYDFTIQSLDLKIKTGDKHGQGTAYLNLGEIYMALNNTKKSEIFVQKGLVIANELKLLEIQMKSHKLLSEVYVSQEQYKEAFLSQLRYKEISDSIFNEKNIKEISALEFQYKFDKEKQAIELAQNKKDIVLIEEQKQQKIIRNAFIVGFILMSLLVLLVFRIYLLKRVSNKEIREKNENLRMLNATKDKFFSIIAHDLRSPFNSLLYFSNLLMVNYKNYDEEKLDEIIKIINENSKSSFDLLENLLTWASSQSGEIEYLPQNIQTKAIITKIFLLFQSIAKNKNIRLLDNTESDLSVFADKNAINTILRNLVANAIKFTKTNGTIIVSAHETKNCDFIEISISDTGVGISDETIDGLFRIDKNVSTLGTQAEKGTGLGLILCKEFVEKNGGTIWVESKVGEGSKFTFSTPIN